MDPPPSTSDNRTWESPALGKKNVRATPTCTRSSGLTLPPLGCHDLPARLSTCSAGGTKRRAASSNACSVSPTTRSLLARTSAAGWSLYTGTWQPNSNKLALQEEASLAPFSHGHPHAIEVLGYCYEHKEIVMECAWHGSFDKLLLATPPPPVRTVVRILLHAARGMLFFHACVNSIDWTSRSKTSCWDASVAIASVAHATRSMSHKLVGKLADFGTLTSNPLDSRAGTSTHQDAVAQEAL
jgi:hypothetical protein